MGLQDPNRLAMLALGVQADAPWTPLQPTLGNGIHLRWSFGALEEFPAGGFYLLRRVSNEGTAAFCVSQLLTRAALGPLVGTADDVTLNTLSLFRSNAAGFAEFSSDRFLRLVDVELPNETFELDLSNRTFLSTAHPAAFRVDYTVALGTPPPGTNSGPTPGGGSSTTFTTYVLTLPLPPSTNITQFAAAAAVRLDPRDRVKADSAISQMGTQALQTGTDCVLHSFYSKPSLTLNHRTRVNGLVRTGGTLTLLSGASVGGTVTQNAPFTPVVTYTRQIVFPPGPGTDVLLEPDQTATIPPGRYRHIRVKSRAQLFLSTGSYFIETLEVVEPQAKLVLNETAGPVELNVLQPFAFRGEILSNITHPNLLVAVIGTGTVRLESAFKGTVLAPNCDLVIGSIPTKVHSGAFFAKNIEVQPDVELVRKPSPALGTPPFITPGSCKISAWSGDHKLEERTLNAAGIVTGTFRASKIDRIEITQSQGGGRLVDLCIFTGATTTNVGWQTISGFTYPLALPVRHPNYAGSGNQPVSLPASQAVALPRVQYGPSSAFAGTPFQELHDGFLVPLVAGGPGTMRSVVTTPVGEAEPPDGQQTPHLDALSSMEMVLLGALSPAIAQMLGLYFKDATAAANTFYDYMIVADTTNQFNRNVNNLLTFLQTTLPQNVTNPQFWITYRVSVGSGAALPAPTNLTGYIMPGAALDAPTGEVVNAAAVAGLVWTLPDGSSGNIPSTAAVSYHVWRASAGANPPPSPIGIPQHTKISDDPQVIALELLEHIPPPTAPDWPPFPLQYLDTGLTPEGWYSYRINGIDIFGRFSVLSSPAVWKQWRPPPDPPPWYFLPNQTNDVVHPHALGALDKLAPPIPPGVEAFALDPNDPLVIKDARYNAWFATLSASEKTNLVGLRVRWNWSYAQIRQAPDTNEFRVYHQPGALNNLSGRTTAVADAGNDQSRVTTNITGSFAANVLTDGYLKIGRTAYRITGNQAGSPLVLTVQNLTHDTPPVPVANVGCVVSVPSKSSFYVDYQKPTSWNARIHVVPYANVLEEVVVGSPAAGGALVSGSGATASGTTLTLPAATALDTVQPHKTHVRLASDTARANKIYLITQVNTASHTLVLDGSPNLSGGTSSFDIGLYVRRYEVFLPVQGSTDRQGARLTTSQSVPMAYANVGVTAADPRTHVSDAANWNGTPFGSRPGNESAVGGPALIHRVHRGRPTAPTVPPDDETVFATRANYRAESFYTFRWVPGSPESGLRTVVLRALDDSVFKNDFLIRTTRAALSPSDPTHVPFFPPDWDTARRQAAANQLNAITSLASYPGLSADARTLLARLPGDEARVFGAGLEEYDFAIRHTRKSLSQADTQYFPPDWTDPLRRTTAANELVAINSPDDYAPLRNDSLRVLAGLPGNERAFSQASPEPLDPADPNNANRVGPDNPENFPVNPALRAYVATLDGRSRNRYFFRAQYVDQAQNRGDISLSSPAVNLPNVVPPRMPTFTRVLAGDVNATLPGDKKITLRWASNREADLAEYRIYRSTDSDAARDTRLMELVASVTVSPGAPRPGEVVHVDAGLRGGQTYTYRVVAVDDAGNASQPSRPLSARAFDTAMPVPPELTVAWVDVAGTMRAQLSWTSEFEVAIQRRGPEHAWIDLAQYRAPGTYTIRDPFSDATSGHMYRAVARSPVGAVAHGPSVPLPPLET